MAHLYASFADASLAEKAAGALLDYGVRQEDISLVAHDDYGKTRQTYGTSDSADLNALDQGGPDSAANNTDLSAKHGLSTTTPKDAEVGAVKGAGVGLGVGILASLAALAVPGVGVLIGTGALASALISALGATALTAGAGAIAGGVTGYLKDQGVPSEAAERYYGAVQSGGALLAVSLPSGDVDELTAQQVLSKYGAADVNAY